MTFHAPWNNSQQTSLLSTHSTSRVFCYLTAMGVAMIMGCDSGFRAVSVYPPSGFDQSPTEVYIYGAGFEEGAAVSVTWIDEDGEAQSEPITDLEILDKFSLRGTIPALAGRLNYPIYPYREFIDYTADVTPGLYSCEAGRRGEAVIWTDAGQDYCDQFGGPLSYASNGSTAPAPYPPGDPGLSVSSYYEWSELLFYCTLNLPADSLMGDQQEELMSRLVPNYGLGCYYQQDTSDDTTDPSSPLIYQYCPLRIPATEINVVVTLPDGSVSEISRGFTFQSLELDYYWGENYGERIRGSFGDLYQMGAPALPSAIALADLDGDYLLDPITANPGDDSVSVVPSWTWYEATLANDPETMLTPIDVAVADFDSSGTLDFITANAGSQNLTLWTSSPMDGSDDSGLLVAYPSVESYPMARQDGATATPRRVVADDLNGDGLMDVAVLLVDDGAENEVLIGLQGSAPPRLSTWRHYTVGQNPSDLAFIDLNLDGLFDLTVTHSDGTGLTVLLNDGLGEMSVATYLPPSPDGGSETLSFSKIGVSNEWDPAFTYAIPQAVDMNQDGNPDLVTLATYNGGSYLSIVTGNGLGSFNDARYLALDETVSALTIGYADDGAFSNPSADVILASSSGDVIVVFNDGTGDFGETRRLTPFNLAGAWATPTAIVAQDFDYDWDYDVILSSTDLEGVFAMFNPSTLYEYYRYTLYRCRI